MLEFKCSSGKREKTTYRAGKNLSKLILREQVLKYLGIALQLAIFSQNNCVQKSDWLCLNVKSVRPRM